MTIFRPFLGAALLLPLFALAPAAAQDLNPRRGFSVNITSPEPQDVIYGEVTIRATVNTKREEDIDRVEFFVDDALVLADTDAPYQVVYNFGKKSGAHVLRAVAHHREGPTASDFLITRSVDLQYVVNVQRVVLDVAVRDRQRHLVQGLGPADFTVVEEGKRPQKLSSVSREERPLLVGIVLDTSGSMRQRMKEAQDAACSFAQTLGPRDRGFVVDFDEQVTLVADTTPDTKELCNAIRTTTAVGGTALYDAVHASYRVLRESPRAPAAPAQQVDADRRAIVLLSDGDDNESRTVFEELLREAQLNDVMIYAIGLDVGGLEGGRRVLQRLADETGGRAYFVAKASELGSVYEDIARELRTLYQLVYTSDNQKFDGRFISLDVKVKGGHEVRHRAGYNAVMP